MNIRGFYIEKKKEQKWAKVRGVSSFPHLGSPQTMGAKHVIERWSIAKNCPTIDSALHHNYRSPGLTKTNRVEDKYL